MIGLGVLMVNHILFHVYEFVVDFFSCDLLLEEHIVGLVARAEVEDGAGLFVDTITRHIFLRTFSSRCRHAFEILRRQQELLALAELNMIDGRASCRTDSIKVTALNFFQFEPRFIIVIL